MSRDILPAAAAPTDDDDDDDASGFHLMGNNLTHARHFSGRKSPFTFAVAFFRPLLLSYIFTSSVYLSIFTF